LGGELPKDGHSNHARGWLFERQAEHQSHLATLARWEDANENLPLPYDRSGGPVSKDDPFIGFWKLNWNKSDVLLTTVALEGDMLTIKEWGGITIERNCDGQDHPEITEVNTVYSCRITDPFTYELVLRQNEKVTFSLTRKISGDGKKMALIRKNASGKTMPELIFERVK
jgi:hypothetical protein